MTSISQTGMYIVDGYETNANNGSFVNTLFFSEADIDHILYTNNPDMDRSYGGARNRNASERRRTIVRKSRRKRRTKGRRRL
jgi:hypothetical protein